MGSLHPLDDVLVEDCRVLGWSRVPMAVLFSLEASLRAGHPDYEQQEPVKPGERSCYKPALLIFDRIVDPIHGVKGWVSQSQIEPFVDADGNSTYGMIRSLTPETAEAGGGYRIAGAFGELVIRSESMRLLVASAAFVRELWLMRMQDSGSQDYDNEQEQAIRRYWSKRIEPLLPDEPLTPAVLDEIAAPLDVFDQALAWEFLAELGREEVAEAAFRLVEKATGFERLTLGHTLLLCGDPRGFAVLDALHLRSLDRDQGNPRDYVPSEWIHETLGEIDTPEALMLHRMLVARSYAKRANSSSGSDAWTPYQLRDLYSFDFLEHIPASIPVFAGENPVSFRCSHWVLSKKDSWSMAFEDPCPSVMLGLSGVLFIALLQGTALSIRGEDGSILNQATLSASDEMDWYDSGTLVALVAGSEIVAFEPTGKFLWKSTAPGAFDFISIAADDGWVQIELTSGEVIRWDPATGTR